MTSAAQLAEHDSKIEEALWQALQQDSLEQDLNSGKFAPNKQIIMGTGRTQNACEMCGNSSKTHGCGGCKA